MHNLLCLCVLGIVTVKRKVEKSMDKSKELDVTTSENGASRLRGTAFFTRYVTT